jgi:hypothetical protein
VDYVNRHPAHIADVDGDDDPCNIPPSASFHSAWRPAKFPHVAKIATNGTDSQHREKLKLLAPIDSQQHNRST